MHSACLCCEHAAKVIVRLRDNQFRPNWTLTPSECLAVRLSLALYKHVPGWTGATDEQLEAVANEILKP